MIALLIKQNLLISYIDFEKRKVLTRGFKVSGYRKYKTLKLQDEKKLPYLVVEKTTKLTHVELKKKQEQYKTINVE